MNLFSLVLFSVLVWQQPNLLDAVVRLDLATARSLLEAGADVNIVNRANETPLMLAAKTGYDDMIRLLLEHNAQTEAISNTGESALFYAVRMGRLEAARILVTNGSPVNSKNRRGLSPPLIALVAGDLSMIQVLLEGGGEPDLADHRGETLLYKAVLMGNHVLAELLVRAGADPSSKNKVSFSPVKLAQLMKQNAILDLLTKPPGKDAPIDTLDLAMLSGSKEAVQALLPADLSLQDERGDTPLILAAKSGRESLVKLLIERGADVNGKGGHGRTPLMAAIHHGRVVLVPVLLAAGADPNAITEIGASTPISLAYQKKDIVALNFLVRAGAKLITLNQQGGQVGLPFSRVNLSIIQDAVDRRKPDYPATGFRAGPRRGGVFSETHPGLTRPVFSKQPAPKFPEKTSGIPSVATVVIEAIFDPDGQIRDLAVVQPAHGGIFGFELNAVKALREWRFRPGQLDGKPVPVQMKVELNFFMD